MAKANKVTTSTVDAATLLTAFKQTLTTHTAVFLNNNRGGGISLCNLIRAMAATGYGKHLIGAMLARAGVPCSPSTLNTQYGSAAGLNAGEVTNGHGPVPDYTTYPAPLLQATDAYAAAMIAECGEGNDGMKALREVAKGLKGARSSATPTSQLPLHLRGKVNA